MFTFQTTPYRQLSTYSGQKQFCCNPKVTIFSNSLSELTDRSPPIATHHSTDPPTFLPGARIPSTDMRRRMKSSPPSTDLRHGQTLWAVNSDSLRISDIDITQNNFFGLSHPRSRPHSIIGPGYPQHIGLPVAECSCVTA